MSKFLQLFVLSIFFLNTLLLPAQTSPDRNKIKALKVAFITERLSLSSSEAEVFWPLYNDFEAKRQALRERQHEEIYDRIDNIGNVSERESKALLQKYLDIEEQEEELDKEYYSKMANAVSAKKTLLLFKAEHDFRRQLIKQMRQRQVSPAN